MMLSAAHGYCVGLLTPASLAGCFLAGHMWSVGDVQICHRPIPAGEMPVVASDCDRRPVAWRWRQVLQGPACRFLRVPGGVQERGRLPWCQ